MRDSKAKAFFLMLFTYFCVGSMVLTVSTVMKSIIAEYSWSDSQGAMIMTMLSTGFLIMSALGSLATEKVGRKTTMLIGGAIMCFSFVLFALLRQPLLYYPLMIIAGLSWGWLNTLVNTVVAELYGGDAARLNLLNACYALGAVLLPLMVGMLTMNGISWRVPCVVVAVLGAMLFVLGLRIRVPESPRLQQSGSAVGHPACAFWRELGFYLSLIIFFVYVGVETAAQSWLSSYLSQTNAFFREYIPSETMVSLMWGMLLAGRLLFAAFGSRIDRRVLLIALAVGFLTGLLGVILLSANTAAAILSVALLGFSMSAMYATAVSNAGRYITGSPVSAGLIFGSAGAGSALMPLLAGIISDALDLRAGMLSLCVFVGLLIIAAVINRRIADRTQA